MTFLKLHFVGDKDPSLFQTEFVFGSIRASAIRGKTSGAFVDQGAFHWSFAVRAMCVLALKTAISLRGFGGDPFIVGGHGSFAASLDYAISKETNWLVDVFGFRDQSIPNYRRLFRRTNSGRKRSGPVAVAFAKPLIQSGAIIIRSNSVDLESFEELSSLLDRLARKEERSTPSTLSSWG